MGALTRARRRGRAAAAAAEAVRPAAPVNGTPTACHPKAPPHPQQEEGDACRLKARRELAQALEHEHKLARAQEFGHLGGG